MRIYLCGGSYLGNGGVFQTIKLGTTDLKKYATINLSIGEMPVHRG